MLIALTGKKYSGKDTAANVLVSEYGMKSIKFAGGLKAMFRVLLEYQGCPPERIERMVEGDLKEVPCHQYLQGKTPRMLMVTLGTEWGRDTIGEKIWLSCFRNKIQATPEVNYVVSDLRFINEAELIRSLGGKIIRIVRERLKQFETDHISETEQEKISVDFEIKNNGTLDDFQKRVDRIIGVEL